MSINNWFNKYAFRPVIVLQLCLYLIFSISALLLYKQHKNDNETVINQSAKHLALAINQKNRSQVDVIISTLIKLDTVESVALCEKNNNVISRNVNKDFCKVNDIENLNVAIAGSDNYFLKVNFKNVFTSSGVLIGAAVTIVGAFISFMIMFNFKKRFEIDLLEKIKNINITDNFSLIKELNEISASINEAQDAKIKSEKDKFLSQVSRQVSHDIRSPLAVLNYLLEHQSNNSFNDAKLIKRSLNRINNIANDLLLDTKLEELNNSKILEAKTNASNFFNNIIEEKILEFKKFELISFEVSISISNNSILPISEKELSRVFSNLINNAVEAMAYKGIVDIRINSDLSNIFIEIEDQGGGVTEDILNKLGDLNFSTKKEGNGIGLHSALKLINEWNGKISFVNLNLGLKVIVSLPYYQLNADAILIDNDEFCRIIWEMKAKTKGISLLTFESHSNFLDIKPLINLATPIYIDSDLGNGNKGEEFAKNLFFEGYSKLYLTTGYSSEDFRDYSFLSGVISKAPPF